MAKYHGRDLDFQPLESAQPFSGNATYRRDDGASAAEAANSGSGDLAAAALARFLVMAMRANFSHRTFFVQFFLQPPQRAVQRFAATYFDFGDGRFHKGPFMVDSMRFGNFCNLRRFPSREIINSSRNAQT